MPGFFVSNTEVNTELKNMYPARCVAEAVAAPGLTAKRHTLNKFMLDKTLSETPEAILIAEGFLLNKKRLFEKYGVADMAALLWTMYRKEGETFFAAFRGSFSGALYDKAEDKWLVYTNQIGDSQVFYTAGDGQWFAGSQTSYIIDACRAAGKPLTFDESAAYQLLSYAFMADNSTLAKEIKRLRGGTYLCIEGGTVTVKEYHRFTKSNPTRFAHKTVDEMIDELDAVFREAIELEYEKDDEYGLSHLADLSGGLDSRMNMWVAHAMKPRHMQLMTYCRANHDDELIAKEIARYWRDELLVKPLDDVHFLYDLDEIIFMNGGLSLYAGITGGKRLLECLNMDLYGLEHTGQVGDAIVGSFYTRLDDGIHHTPTYRYSEKLTHRLTVDYKALCRELGDHELYLLYTRGFNGALNTHPLRKNYTDVVSPFLYPEFLQLCLDIPVEERIGHNLYKRWIIRKYPDAARFRWEKTGAKITEPLLVAKFRRLVTRGPKKLLRILGKDALIKTGMTPLDYWFAHDARLREYMNTYEAEGYAQLPSSVSQQLIDDMKWLYATGNFWEKTMVLTVLAGAKLYFG